MKRIIKVFALFMLTFSNAYGQTVNCCDGSNLIQDGDFEQAVQGTLGAEYHPGDPSPGGIIVIDAPSANSLCGDWLIEDHTFCVNGGNNHVLIVNGQTQQTANVNNVIWQSAVNVQVDSQYKFCAFAQHLPQCCFDIVPTIHIETRDIGGTWTSILTVNLTPGDPLDPCDWEQINASFIATSNAMDIRILIEEMANGDGNDFALDDISLTKKENQNIVFSLQDQPLGLNTYTITTSINSMLTTDDALSDPSCTHTWTVAEITTLSPTPITPGTITVNPAWGTTTTFTGYNGGSPDGIFNYNQGYLISLSVDSCDCAADDDSYQLIYNSGRSSGITASPIFKLKDLPKEQQKLIKDKIKEAKKRQSVTSLEDTPTSSSVNSIIAETTLQVMPNPFSKNLIAHIELPKSSTITLKLITMDGQTVLAKGLGELDAGQHRTILNFENSRRSNGMYFLVVETDDGILTKKVIKIKQ